MSAEGSVYLQIGADGWTEFAFGSVTASGQLEYSKTIVFFRWNGSGDGDEVSGDGSAELQDDGTTEIEIGFDNSDDAILIGRHE